MSSDSSSNASDTELDLSNVRRVDEKKRKWGEASGGLRETFLSLPRPQAPPPPSAIDFHRVPVAKTLFSLYLNKNRPELTPFYPIDHPHSPPNKLTMTVRCGDKVQGRRGDCQRCERFYFFFHPISKAVGRKNQALISFSLPSLSCPSDRSTTAALKAVIAECKVGAKLVDIANKGDALIEE